jgi:hypothetical protein
MLLYIDIETRLLMTGYLYRDIEIAEINLGLPSARISGASWGSFIFIACDPCALWGDDHQYGGEKNRFSGDPVQVRTINPSLSIISRCNDFGPRMKYSYGWS